jgi:pimeloyl-[acyl-carrier protein] methyl ester esterase
MNAKTMVFLHGWGTHPLIWAPLLEWFPGARALPLPGYAQSEPAFGLDEMAARTAAQMEAGSHLVGWSLGGQVAVRLALDFPEKVSRLTLIAATPCFVNREDWPHGIAAGVFDQFAANLAQDYAGTIRRFLSLQAQGSSDMREVLSQLRRKLLDQARPAAGVLEAGLDILQNEDLRKGMRALAVPLTLIHGTGDKLAPVAAAHWLAETVPHARLHVIEGAGHAPFLSHPRQVAEIIGGAVPTPTLSSKWGGGEGWPPTDLTHG